VLTSILIAVLLAQYPMAALPSADLTVQNGQIVLKCKAFEARANQTKFLQNGTVIVFTGTKDTLVTLECPAEGLTMSGQRIEYSVAGGKIVIHGTGTAVISGDKVGDK
jgi:hypothetical protein